MILGRRDIMVLGGIGLTGFVLPGFAFAATDAATIEMRGTPRGEHVWFSPQGIAVRPGTVIRWVNRDPGNSHTTTAYGAADYDRQRRIPETADPWDSDYLLPNDSFEITLTVPGVYDYYCLPHEMAGMVGRIIVGTPDDHGWQDAAPDGDGLPDAALAAFPAVGDILLNTRIEAAQAVSIAD